LLGLIYSCNIGLGFGGKGLRRLEEGIKNGELKGITLRVVAKI